MKKKLLYISQCFPLPLDGGGKIKTYNSLKTLSKKFNIFAVFVSEREASKAGLKKFEQLGINVKVFQAELMAEDIKKNYLKLAWNYLQFRPHFVYQYRYLPAMRWIKDKIISWQPEIIHVDHINSAQFLPSKKWLYQNCQTRPALILENHNLDHRLFFTRFKHAKKLIRKLYLLLEGSLNWLYGEINYRRFDHIFTISDQETNYLEKKHCSVHTQELVYPLTTVKKRSLKKNIDILFIGYLEWPPNKVAAEWFCKEVLPLINQKMPEVKLHIVGANNPKLSYLSQRKNILFHGYQKKLDSFLNQARTFVLPFKTGAGVRIKALTALESGVPFVATKLGVEGLNLTHNREYLLAETKQQFADQIIKLLKNKNLRNKISLNQQQYFQRHHSPKKNQHYLQKYQQLTNSPDIFV